MDTVNIFFLKQIVRAAKEVSYKPSTLIVHQEAVSQGGGRSSVRWLVGRRLHQVRSREAKHHEVLARQKWVEPSKQEVDLRHDLHG